MKKVIVLSLMALAGAMAATAQYFNTEKGTKIYYKVVSNEGKTTEERAARATVLSVETKADGVVAMDMELVQAPSDNPFAEVKTQSHFYYDPATGITTVVEMTGDDFKTFVMDQIREAALAAGQHLSEMDLADLAKVMSVKGQVEFTIDPKAEAGTKIPNSSLRLSAGQMTMSMNLWEGQYLGKETITVAAGTFECAKLSYTMRISSPNGNEKKYVTDWYAEGIGMVRCLTTDKKGKVLSEEELLSVKAPQEAE